MTQPVTMPRVIDKSLFKRAYAAARNDLGASIQNANDEGVVFDQNILSDAIIKVFEHTPGLRFVWKYDLTIEQQSNLLCAVVWALHDRQLLDPCYSAKVDRHIRKRHPEPYSSAWYDVVLQPARVAAE